MSNETYLHVARALDKKAFNGGWLSYQRCNIVYQLLYRQFSI